MTKRNVGLLARVFQPALRLAILTALSGSAGASPAGTAPSPGDSTRALAPAADTSRALAPPGVRSSTMPHDAVHTRPAPAASKPGAPKPKPFRIVVPKGTPRVQKVTLGIRHRVFPDFAEKAEAEMRKPFQIGDTRFSATVTDFEPDFVIEEATHSISSRSSEPRNPAVRLIVREQGVAEDTTWAFLNMPPHFMRNSLLAFEILRIDFADRPPLLRDSTRFGRPKP